MPKAGTSAGDWFPDVRPGVGPTSDLGDCQRFRGIARARERSDARAFSSSHRRMTGARNFRVLSVSRLIHASIRPSNSLPMPMGSWRGIAPLVPPRSAEFAMLNVG
jgi:hypothetical protein